MSTSRTQSTPPVKSAVGKFEKAVPVKNASAKRPSRTTNAAPKPVAARPASKSTEGQIPVGKPVKAKKPKLVRDSFTMPKVEYAVIESLKLRATALTLPAKKSELLRAGIKALAAMSDIDFTSAMSAVPTLKTGRPKQNRT